MSCVPSAPIRDFNKLPPFMINDLGWKARIMSGMKERAREKRERERGAKRERETETETDGHTILSS